MILISISKVKFKAEYCNSDLIFTEVNNRLASLLYHKVITPSDPYIKTFAVICQDVP